MGDSSSPEKSMYPGDKSNESGSAISLVSVNTDAITALNAALGGIALLSQVVTFIQDAVIDVGVARFHGIEDIASYTAAKKEEIDAQTTLAKTSIGEHAASAIQTAIQNNMQSIANGVLEWLKRQGW